MNFFKTVESFLATNIVSNKKTVFTNGCFDILHVGHVRYLKQSKALGDLLIIGLNSDSSVKRLKGSNRPVNSESERAEVLLALASVDCVVLFDDDTPFHLIKNIKPKVLTKGGDYKKKDIVGASMVEKNGGKVVLIPFVEGKSTSALIEKCVR